MKIEFKIFQNCILQKERIHVLYLLNLSTEQCQSLIHLIIFVISISYSDNILKYQQGIPLVIKYPTRLTKLGLAENQKFIIKIFSFVQYYTAKKLNI